MNIDSDAMELLGAILRAVLSSPATPIPVDARDQLLAALDSGGATLEIIEFEGKTAVEVTLEGHAIGCVLLADLVNAAASVRVELPPTIAAELAAKFLAGISTSPADEVACAMALDGARKRVAAGVPEA